MRRCQADTINKHNLFKYSSSIPIKDQLHFYVRSRVKEIMDKKGLSIYEVSKISGLKYDTVKSYYNGEVQRPDSYIRAVLCATLECNLNELEELTFYEEDVFIDNRLEKV